MQIRPVRATGPSAAGGPRPQFFKIVGGKPVQISAANLHRLPASAITSIQPQAGRVMYMRAPGPASTSAVTSATSSALATSAAGVTTLASSGVAAASSGNKIILLSNKGQGIPVSKAGGAPPSIVRVVSPNSVTSGIGGKITLSPGSPTKLAALRPAGKLAQKTRCSTFKKMTIYILFKRIVCAHFASHCRSKACGRISTNSVANGAFAEICSEQCWRQEVRRFSQGHSSAFAQESITSAIRYLISMSSKCG